MFRNVEAFPGDPILSLMEAFVADARPEKTNLGIGLYYDEAGRIPVLASVRQAATLVRDAGKPHTYLPMEGDAAFRTAVQHIVFGSDSEAVTSGRIATIQSIGGSGAIHIAARFLKATLPDSRIWISNPTWDNHRVLLESAGLAVDTYPYFDARTNGVDFDGMLAMLGTLPERSIVLLQPSCHNPTGADLSAAQFAQVIHVLKRRNLLPFVDMAYQGFGEGLDEDAAPIRSMVDAGLLVVVSNSFSKNFSLYGERVGALSIVCADAETAARVQGQLKAAVRKVYSSPPAFGSQLVSAILTSQTLSQQWQHEVGAMQQRMKTMRQKLRAALEAIAPEVDARYLTDQRGMFSYTGLTATEVDVLREQKSIYLVQSGRMCVAGLNDGNVAYVGEAIADVLRQRTAVLS
ncbi:MULTISPECIES: amino acid aminotransferase [Burkholderia]|uniref:amino acid aminotransferase n=1 Tax=Burkholderia TaxID=32008 RepID=UPI000F561BED|nr:MULTISPECIES: amino acid aminotransferase [Burkholderia]MCW3641095.1 aspartate/tyrosine/aromatic aminotransferase [Burkholderia cenocepacia]RQR70840.1 aspartate/tyrosine/aromatic aminotransferase [Burkholderia sp. Bp9011]RQR83649.1 aspartate/tyrosine/aromatic aminotransferase [Burkholderia sp. Bp9010]RQS52154.1 aspartate/tyrosine/aromatic aminotransferase [Burkholderia sp. Bp8984]RQS64379.1 aspartate/tyrosine/aromatic aminotransferase [Burkholderia sp. Bp8977]